MTKAYLQSVVSQKRAISEMKGVPFDLTLENLPPIPEICPALGIPLIRSGGSRSDDYSPSLDRIIPERGYVAQNVIWVSVRANRIKTNAHWSELQRVASFYSKITPSDHLPSLCYSRSEIESFRAKSKLEKAKRDKAIRDALKAKKLNKPKTKYAIKKERSINRASVAKDCRNYLRRELPEILGEFGYQKKKFIGRIRYVKVIQR